MQSARQKLFVTGLSSFWSCTICFEVYFVCAFVKCCKFNYCFFIVRHWQKPLRSSLEKKLYSRQLFFDDNNQEREIGLAWDKLFHNLWIAFNPKCFFIITACLRRSHLLWHSESLVIDFPCHQQGIQPFTLYQSVAMNVVPKHIGSF